MDDPRNPRVEHVEVERSNGGRTIAIILIAVVLVVGVLFATGFWSADVEKTGELPTVAVEGGALPKVDLDSKEVIVGTTEAEVEVPTIETKKTTIDVPVVGVKDNGEK